MRKKDKKVKEQKDKSMKEFECFRKVVRRIIRAEIEGMMQESPVCPDTVPSLGDISKEQWLSKINAAGALIGEKESEESDKEEIKTTTEEEDVED